MLKYGERKKPPSPTSAQAAKNGRRSKDFSPWSLSPHVAELHNYQRLRAWQRVTLLQQGDDDGS